MTMEIVEIESLKWGPPKTVAGGKYTLKEADPTEGFWALYRRYKDDLNKAGIKVAQFRGKWTVNWWMNEGTFNYPSLPGYLPNQPEVEEEVEYDVEPLELKPLVNETGFKPWQPVLVQMTVAAMELEGSSSLDGCGTGVGKTFITLGAIRERGRRALIVCPKVLALKWQRTCFKMGVECAGAFGWEWMKTGKTGFGHWQKEYTATGKEKKGKGTFVWTVPGDVDLVFDEAHRAGGMDTQNGKMVLASKVANIPTYLLSATLADTPTKMRAAGYVLGLHKDGGDFYSWMARHGVVQKSFVVNGRTIIEYKFEGTKYQLQKIRRSIFPRKGVRVRAEEIPGFPKTQIIAEPYEMENVDEIRDAYNEMQQKVDEIMHDREVAGGDKQASILVEILRARQRVELLKVPLMISLTRDSIEEGNSVIISVNFKETLKEICDALKVKAIIAGISTGKYIDPDYNDHRRQDAIDNFTADKERICAGIIAAMREGVDLDDQHGNYPREVFISPPESSLYLKQVLGRVQRGGTMTPSKQTILFAANTIEEEVCERLANKLDNIDLLMDGDLLDGIFPEGYSSMREAAARPSDNIPF